MIAVEYTHVWVWRWRTWTFPGLTFKGPWFGDGVDRVGMRCRVVARGSMNSARIRFEDGSEFVTSRGGIRRADPAGEGAASGAPVAARPAPGDTSR